MTIFASIRCISMNKGKEMWKVISKWQICESGRYKGINRSQAG